MFEHWENLCGELVALSDGVWFVIRVSAADFLNNFLVLLKRLYSIPRERDGRIGWIFSSSILVPLVSCSVFLVMNGACWRWKNSRKFRAIPHRNCEWWWSSLYFAVIFAWVHLWRQESMRPGCGSLACERIMLLVVCKCRKSKLTSRQTGRIGASAVSSELTFTVKPV